MPGLCILLYIRQRTGKVQLIVRGRMKKKCGELKFRIFCKNGHVEEIREHCDRWDCSRCVPHLISRLASRIADRLEVVKGHIEHYTVSYRTGGTRKDGIEVAKHFGVRGGVLVGHTKDKRGGNHFHILGFGKLNFKLIAKELKGGAVIVKHIRSVFEPFKVARYELDHDLDIVGNKHRSIWFGELSYNKMICEIKVYDHEPRLCKCCGLPMYCGKPRDREESVIEPYPIFEKITNKIYKLKKEIKF